MSFHFMRGCGCVAAMIGVLALRAYGAQPAAPIAATGYNKDVIVESSATNPGAAITMGFDSTIAANSGNTWYQTGYKLPNGTITTGGLPASNTPISYTDPNGLSTRFQLQSYTANNALILTPSLPTATLTLQTPAYYSEISILAASTFGGYPATMTLHFTDGSSSSAFSFETSDWWSQNANTPEPVTTQQVLSVNGGSASLENPYSVANMYDSPITLSGSNATKLISSLSFSYNPGPYTFGDASSSPAVGGNVGIFAVSGVPEPTATGALLLAAIFGLLCRAGRQHRA